MDAEADPEADGLTDLDALLLPDLEADLDPDLDPLIDGDPLLLADLEAEADGERDADPEAISASIGCVQIA